MLKRTLIVIAVALLAIFVPWLVGEYLGRWLFNKQGHPTPDLFIWLVGLVLSGIIILVVSMIGMVYNYIKNGET